MSGPEQPEKGVAWGEFLARKEARAWPDLVSAVREERAADPEQGLVGLDMTGHPTSMAMGECVQDAVIKGITWADMHRETGIPGRRLERRRVYYLQRAENTSVLAHDVVHFTEAMMDAARPTALGAGSTPAGRAEMARLITLALQLQIATTVEAGIGSKIAQAAKDGQLPTEEEAKQILVTKRKRTR